MKVKRYVRDDYKNDYQEKVANDWWDFLSENRKQEVIDTIYPDDIILDLNEGWYGLTAYLRIEIYNEENS